MSEKKRFQCAHLRACGWWILNSRSPTARDLESLKYIFKLKSDFPMFQEHLANRQRCWRQRRITLRKNRQCYTFLVLIFAFICNF